MSDTYFGTFEDLSDPERGRDEEYEAWQDSLLEQEPPDVYEPPCVACNGSGVRCCDVASMETLRQQHERLRGRLLHMGGWLSSPQAALASETVWQAQFVRWRETWAEVLRLGDVLRAARPEGGERDG